MHAVRALVLLAIFGITTAAQATPERAGDPSDHDRARRAVAAGERKSLSAILAVIEAREGGRILEIERDRLAGREVYEIEILQEDGRVIELTVDAIDGAVLDAGIDD